MCNAKCMFYGSIVKHVLQVNDYNKNIFRDFLDVCDGTCLLIAKREFVFMVHILYVRSVVTG